MLLIEVYVQGVSRFLTPFKFPLVSGYTVVYGGNETGKTALAHALVATFDAQYAAALEARLRPVVPQDGAARYGALFEHGGQSYRLLRDLAGGVNLAKLNADTQKFELIAKEENGVQAFLQDVLDFPLDGRHAMLGFIDRHLMPAGAGGALAPSAPSFDSGFDRFEQYADQEAEEAPPQDIEATLKQLRRELQILGSIDELEFRVDGLQKKKFETEANLAKFKDIDAKLKGIDERTEVIGAIQALTPELEARVKNLEEQEKYQRTRLTAIDVEIEALEKKLDVLEPKATKQLLKDPFFLGGAAAALIGFVLPFLTYEFLVILGFAGAGWCAYLFFMVYPKAKADLDEVNKKYKGKLAEEEKVKKDFETATATIKDLVVKVKVLDARDLLALAAEWRQLRENEVALKQHRDELAKTVGDSTKLRADLQRQEAEIALFEEELRNAGAISRDSNQIQAEINRLEAQLASGGGASAAGAARAVAQAAAAAVAAPAVGATLGGLLQAAAETARLDLERLIEQATEKINTYVRALSGGKLGPVEIDAAGSLSLVRAEYGAMKFTLDKLSDGARDTVLLAVRIGLLEVVLPKRPFPVICDDPFALLDDARQAVAGKALKRIAGLTQVIHFAPMKSFLALADGKVELK